MASICHAVMYPPNEVKSVSVYKISLTFKCVVLQKLCYMLASGVLVFYMRFLLDKEVFMQGDHKGFG